MVVSLMGKPSVKVSVHRAEDQPQPSAGRLNIGANVCHFDIYLDVNIIELVILFGFILPLTENIF